MIVRDFTRRKVSDFLSTGNYRRALIRFHHGLGDAIAFYPCFERLRQLYPAVDLKFHVHCGQEEIFGQADDGEAGYDIVFELPYPCSEWTHPERTKAENSCIEELGISPPAPALALPKRFPSPLVGLHFFSTCMPQTLGCPEDAARRLWRQLIDAELVPLDTHMSHYFDNPENRPFQWADCAIRSAKATLPNLIGTIGCCCGFAGVSSGNFHVALALFPPELVLFLRNDIPAERLTRLPVAQLDVRNYDAGIVRDWISRIKARRRA